MGCSFEKLVPDEGHKAAIRDAVQRTHRATLLATELANLHLRRCLEERGGEGVSDLFKPNWLLNVYNEVTVGGGRGKRPKVAAALRETRDRLMPEFDPPEREGLTQVLAYECRNLAATAANNVWMHFQKRLLSHVRRAQALDAEAYASLSKPQRVERKKGLMRVAEDLARIPS